MVSLEFRFEDSPRGICGLGITFDRTTFWLIEYGGSSRFALSINSWIESYEDMYGEDSSEYGVMELKFEQFIETFDPLYYHISEYTPDDN